MKNVIQSARAKDKVPIMTSNKMRALIAATIATTAILSMSAYAQLAGFGGDKIKPPSDLGKLYTTIDRADNKQFREYYANSVATEGMQKNGTLPAGSVLTGVLFKAKLDATGIPEKASDGRFIKDALIGYIVMEKEKDWGSTIPAELRNGEWEYQVFTADKSVNDKANLKACFECHRDKVGSVKDFVFTRDLIGK